VTEGAVVSTSKTLFLDALTKQNSFWSQRLKANMCL